MPKGMKWSRENDGKLMIAVAEIGDDKWDEVAARIPNSTPRSCRERYRIMYQVPLPWNDDLDRRLLGLVAQWGHKWQFISKFVGRVAGTCSSRWKTLTRSISKPMEYVLPIVPTDDYDPKWDFKAIDE
jgi:hypothetical protein